MSIDPFFTSRLMAQGTAGAEFIYNEMLGRLVASGFRILSRIETAPAGSPATFDAYIVPTGGTGEWAGLDGSIVFWVNGWLPMDISPGMHLFIVDESKWVNFPTALASEATAVDGSTVITPVFETGAWRINWDCRLGTAASVTLTEDSILMPPTNMQPGRRYILRVIQDGVGTNDVTLEVGTWTSIDGVASVAVQLQPNEVTDLVIRAPQPPENHPTLISTHGPLETTVSPPP